MIMAKKGYNYPIKKKIPLILLLNLFGITIISHFLRFVNIFREILSHYLPGGRKKPPFTQGSFFTFIYTLSIFLTSTAFVSTNAKYGIPLSRYTVFLQNCPLGYTLKVCSFLFCLLSLTVCYGVFDYFNEYIRDFFHRLDRNEFKS